MKKGLTEIIFILDESGSMAHMKDAAIKGFNSLLEEQKSLQEGEATLSLITFNHEYECIVDCLNIQEVLPLNENSYNPCGSTALYDCIGNVIEVTGTRLLWTSEEERPEKILIAIFTDGEENSSVKFKADLIKQMIEHQQNKYNWEFLFLACNQDAMMAARDIGINNYSNVAFTPQGMDGMYTACTDSITEFRSKGLVSQMPEDIK